MQDKKLRSSDITPESVYMNRRNFMRAGLLAGTAAVTGLTYRFFNPQSTSQLDTTAPNISNVQPSEPAIAVGKPNTFEEITNYNNFYEFSTDKRAVAGESKKLITRPWTVDVGGLVQKPKTFD